MNAFSKIVFAALMLCLCNIGSASTCSASYSTRNDWVNGFVIDVVLTNSGSTPVSDWTVSWTYGTPVQLVNRPWNAAVNISGNTVNSFDDGSHPTLAPGQSVSYGMAVSFSGGTKPVPGLLSVAGTGCAGSMAFYADPQALSTAWVNSHSGDGRMPAIKQFISSVPGAKWFTSDSVDIGTAVNNYVSAAAAVHQVPVLVSYNIPGRDCGQFSSGGAGSIADYQSWISGFAAAIASRQAIVILEPDALPQSSCAALSAAQQAERLALFPYAVGQFKSLAPNAWLYIDIGNSAWLSPSDAATLLINAGIADAHGFSLNVSNYRSDTETNQYGIAINNILQQQKGFTKPFIVDTSRNGNGPDGSVWCNPLHRKIGLLPKQNPAGSNPEMTLWVNTPGSSDGTCNGLGPAGTWDPQWAYDMIYGY
jgi:endoglucanase